MFENFECLENINDCADLFSPAAYDLRIDPNYVIVNGKLIHPEDIKLNDNSFTLEAHKFAVVRSREKLKLPNNICAHVGLRFTYALKGIVAFIGPQVDPGYNDYFYALIYNNNEEDVTINVNHGFFKIEFCYLDKEEKDIPRTVFDKKRETEDYKNKTQKDPLKDIEDRVYRLEKKIDSINIENNELKHKIDTVEKGYQPIILFGYFIVFSTIFGAIISVMLQSSANLSSKMSQFIISVFVTINIIFVIIMTYIVSKLLGKVKS